MDDNQYTDIVSEINETIDRIYRPHKDKTLICNKEDFEAGEIPVMMIHQFRNGKPYDFFKNIWPTQYCPKGEIYAVPSVIPEKPPTISSTAMMYEQGLLEKALTGWVVENARRWTWPTP